MPAFVEPDLIRARFAAALSDMYRAEVPLYADLLEIVSNVNARTDDAAPERIAVERHGAIRLGTAQELAMMARAFAVLGMVPVGYYDLAMAGVPVHSTAFRPVTETALAANPFRVFCSLLRIELIGDAALRKEVAAILARRAIFSPEALDLINRAERDGGLDDTAAHAFVAAMLETFRWHSEATVTAETYQRLAAQHRLIADIVAFKGPHINHLTPRTLDIDAVQAQMGARGIDAKAVIEGPPARKIPILLRQTSFKALTEAVSFAGQEGQHTARFGEIEQRGAALTPKGRALYDRLLAAVDPHAFDAFPDDFATLVREDLIYVRHGAHGLEPITYEDFLPVSAAGIFQSNLAGEARRDYGEVSSQAAFEAALGRAVIDPFALYAALAATPSMGQPGRPPS